MSVQSRQIAVPRPTGARLQRAALLRTLESSGEPLVLLKVDEVGAGGSDHPAPW